MLLSLSIVSLLIGPLFLSWFKYSRHLDNFLFSFVLFSVGGILALEVAPTLWQHIGIWMIPMLIIGFLGPRLVEVGFHNAADKAHNMALLLGIIGLMLHSALDGAAVVQTADNKMLPYAVILHRLVVGLSLFWLVQPLWGKSKTYFVIGTMIVATIIGFYLGENKLLQLHNNGIDLFQALVSGTLLHVIIHRPNIDDDGRNHDHAHALAHDPNHKHDHAIVIKHKGYFVAGIVAGLGLLYLLHQIH